MRLNKYVTQEEMSEKLNRNIRTIESFLYTINR